jgi:rhamnose utilization protein RhaD (predicted bifunctional aldolase and dehydrogenase)
MSPFETEFAELKELSARAGKDPHVVQGAGGNTSIKEGSILWIKASGTWLAHTLEKDIFVPVRLDPLQRALALDSGDAENAAQFVVAEQNPHGLRPSIETSVHAVIPHRIVVHVHCVEAIARAVRADAEAALAPLLEGLDWIFVPYRRPGLPLAKAIAAHQTKRTCVYILGNHGLVVAGASVAEASALLGDVRKRLAATARPAKDADIAELEAQAAGSAYEPARDDAAHAVATDPVSLAFAKSGSLYPDHVIFLGPKSAVAREGENASDTRNRMLASGAPEPVSILYPGLGVLMHRNATDGAHAMARCLADVTARIPEGAKLNTLTETDHSALLNWDAEKYRQALAAGTLS